MKLVVLDPGFHWISGHHFTVNELIRAECLRRGIGWDLLASRKVPRRGADELGARAIFRFSPYDAVDNKLSIPELAASVLFVNGNSLTYEDLQAARLEIAAEDTILVHTITSTQLLAIATWHLRCPAPRPRLAVILRFPPDSYAPPGQEKLAEIHFRQAVKVLSSSGAALGADSVPLAKRVQPYWPRKVVVLPIPLALDEPVVPAARAQTGLHLVYLGEARPEKGFDLLGHALVRAFSRHDSLRVTVQCADCPPDLLQRIADAFRKISPSIEVTGESLPLDRYRSLVASADGVLVAYNPHSYTYRTSHVFVDALAEGKPVIYTAGSWMAGEADRLCPPGVACGPVMADFSVDSLAAAIDALVAGYDRYAAGAQAVMPLVRAQHNRRAYLDALFQLLGSDHG